MAEFENSGDHRGSNAFQGASVTNDGQIIGTQNNYYASAPAPPEVSAADLKAAGDLLASLPEDAVPKPAPLPAGSAVTFRPNPHFVGRQQDLKALARALKRGGTSAIGPTAAATGLGGLGKTQLAAEFAHRYGRFFAGGVYWLSCAKAAGIRGEVTRCAQAMGLPVDDQDSIGRVLARWQSPLPTLLIFDNCEEEDLLAEWRPPSGAARVLVTSRRATWSSGLGVEALPLGTLTPAEGAALLHGFRPDLPADDPGLAAISEELGHLPLALHLAGSYLRRYRHVPEGTPAAYLAALRAAPGLDHDFLAGGEWSPTGHDLNVARTFTLSLDRLDADDLADRTAWVLLFLIHAFAPGEPIPRWLIHRAAASLETPIDPKAAEDGLRRLLELGLIEEEDPDEGTLRMHRLVARFLAAHADTARRVVEKAVLEAAREQNATGLPGPLLAWQPHLRFVAETAADQGTEGAWVL
ncbi:hypothetical protein [Roseospirillum parvum]|uniref:NB-ARC domain-containing protein n=1 Tax=Roseospirillum parvum TaxID=83401 RepID=A0A1G7X1Y3_9PROT|nr:hypothetical protein [Roseospirillum parvum]SDG78204.1 hypothetical protein SAMN05421742_102403 [Roseospirillum parvum]